MIGDNLLVTQQHKLKADEITAHLFEKYSNKKMIVTIGGENGVGKSETAYLVRSNLWKNYKIRSYIIQLDDYYTSNWVYRHDVRKENGIENVGICEIEWEDISHHIEQFKVINDNKDNYFGINQINLYTNCYEKVILNKEDIDILIVEGLYANKLDSDFSIHLEGSFTDTKEFRDERDGDEQNGVFATLALQKEQEDILKIDKEIDLSLPFIVNSKL